MSTLAALCTFERLLHVMTHGRLVNLLASAVLLNASDSIAPPTASMDSPRSAAADEQHASSQVTALEPPQRHLCSMAQGVAVLMSSGACHAAKPWKIMQLLPPRTDGPLCMSVISIEHLHIDTSKTTWAHRKQIQHVLWFPTMHCTAQCSWALLVLSCDPRCLHSCWLLIQLCGVAEVPVSVI